MNITTAAFNEVKIIVVHAKQVGMSKEELTMELARYRNTAMYVHGIHKSDYVSFATKLINEY